jgi:branched-chain amino acid transport system substrate-binding protein
VSQIDRRQTLKLLGALGALGATGLNGACSIDAITGNNNGSSSAAAEPIRIGLMAPRSGGLKPIGDELINGFQLYLSLNNKQLGGHPTTVLLQDEGETAASGKAALDRLLKQNVLAMTGVVSSDVMLAIRDSVEKAQVPLVGSNASPASLQGVIYIWRTSYVNDEPGSALGTYLSSRVNGKVALIAANNVAGEDEIDGFKRAFGTADSRLLPVVWTANTSTPNKEFFTQYLNVIRSQGPQTVFCFYAGSAAVEFVRQFRSVGLTQPIYAPGFLTEGGVLQTLGNAAKNIYTAMNYSPDLDNEANRRFAGAYRRTYGTVPSTYAMASYDAATVLDKAIRLAGDTLTTQRINLMLGKVGQIDSPRGPWQFNQPRTPQQKWYLRQVRADGPVLANVLLNDLGTLG